MGKQVKTPRFYVDIPTFLHATGQLGWDDIKGGAELLYMNCANPYTRPSDQSSPTFFMIGHPNTNAPKTSFPINFCALLNHNLASDSKPFGVVGKKGLISNDGTHPRLHANLGAVSNVLNTPNPTYDDLAPSYNGTNIWTFSDKDGENDYWRSFELFFPDGFNDYTHQLGSFVVGKYFDCPRTPDLNVTMSRRFDGIKKQKTIGGKQLANIYYDGPTEWTMNSKNADFGRDATYKYPPFELDTTAKVDGDGYRFDFRAKSGLGRKGLRSWDLTFSYISESDMWINSEVSNKVINDDVEDGQSPTTGIDANPMLSDNSFNFVYNCTLAGALPFIFTDDKDSNAPDRYSICTFRENSFKVTQIAFNTYNVSMTIDEIA